MERKNISIRTYKRKAQIWFGTEADSFSYDFDGIFHFRCAWMEKS